MLLALERGRGPLTLSEVGKRSGLHPAKAHRYLVSLVRTGLATQNPATGLYDLGPASRHLGIEALRRADSVSTASAHAVELRDETGHTVEVAVWSDAGPMIVRWDTGTHVLPIAVRVGSTLPMLDSAVGHVFLAYLPSKAVAGVLRTQQRQSETRRIGTAEIAQLADGVRRDGFASTINQMIFGLAALAAPVFGADGGLETVLGMVLPGRMSRPRRRAASAPCCARPPTAPRTSSAWSRLTSAGPRGRGGNLPCARGRRPRDVTLSIVG